MFVTLATPTKWGPSELLCLSVMALHLATLLLRPIAPRALYVALFLFWRLSYNIGLGVLLTSQSTSAAITRWLDNAPPATKSLVKWAVTASLAPESYSWARTPVEFNAWVAFRALAMLVLANDGLSYVVLAIACFKPLAESSSMELAVCAVVGSALVAFSIWSKAAAHNCLGDFAWYWGDFFFVCEGELSFDGVFELFPHPMYTVGYSAYYGMSLLTRSYTLFFVSLLAHTAQILFLVAVEEPHIQKIYGTPASPSPSNDAAATSAVVDASPTREPSMVGLWRPSVFRVGDVALLTLLAATAVLVLFANPSPSLLVLVLIAVRALHWIGLGGVLHRQSVSQTWTKRAASEQGMSAAQAYAAWAQIWNASWTLNHVLFVVVAFAIAPNPYLSVRNLFAPVSISHIFGGLTLVWVSILSCMSAHQTLCGADGFFYRDFFFQPIASDTPGISEGDCTSDSSTSSGSSSSNAAVPASACYKGVFRYVNNPECVLGYLAYYGLGIILQSWAIVFLAFASQAAHASFIVLVETPHLKSTYSGVRGAAALERTIRVQAARVADAVPVVGQLRDELKLTARRSRSLLTQQKRHVDTARNRIRGKREQLISDVASLNVKLREHKLYLRAIEIHAEAREKIQTFDGEEIVSMLERRGVNIDRDAEMPADVSDVSDTSPILRPLSGAVKTRKADVLDVGATIRSSSAVKLTIS
jgi:phosphatidylethanolamine N-methyltransferase